METNIRINKEEADMIASAFLHESSDWLIKSSDLRQSGELNRAATCHRLYKKYDALYDKWDAIREELELSQNEEDLDIFLRQARIAEEAI